MKTLKVSDVFHFTFIFIYIFAFLISSLFFHFILTKFKPTNISFDNKKEKSCKEYVKHPNWSCNYKQITGFMAGGLVKVIRGRGIGWQVDLIIPCFFQIKWILKKYIWGRKNNTPLNLRLISH